MSCTVLHMKSRVGHLLSNEDSERPLGIKIFLAANGSDFLTRNRQFSDVRKEYFMSQDGIAKRSVSKWSLQSVSSTCVLWFDPGLRHEWRFWLKCCEQITFTARVHVFDNEHSWALEKACQLTRCPSIRSEHYLKLFRNLCKFNVYQYHSNLSKLVVHLPASNRTRIWKLVFHPDVACKRQNRSRLKAFVPTSLRFASVCYCGYVQQIYKYDLCLYVGRSPACSVFVTTSLAVLLSSFAYIWNDCPNSLKITYVENSHLRHVRT